MLPSVIGGPGERWSMLPVDCGEDFVRSVAPLTR